MRNAGILEGDLVAVHHTLIAQNGQIVVARLEDEVTIKDFIVRASGWNCARKTLTIQSLK